MNGVFWEEGLGLIGGDGRVDDNIITLLPVDGGGDPVLITGLKGCVCVGSGEYETFESGDY